MNETPNSAMLPGAPSPEIAFWRPGLRLQVQSVLYNNDYKAIERAVVSLARAAELAVTAGACADVTLRYGDSSSRPCIDQEALDALRRSHVGTLSIEYVHFQGNLGSARGHNRLANRAKADIILVQNPDVVVSPRLIEILLDCFRRPGVGVAEAKQVPIEHPKDYDPVTGETSWATTACTMIPMPLFRQLGGFDAGSFFLYCDDVDFSWLVRRRGFKVVFQPAAIAFHDKRLSRTAEWQPSSAEQYYTAEAVLFMAHKWSRPDLVKELLKDYTRSGDENRAKAAEVFVKRRREGQLPKPLDPEHRVGQFINNFNSYAKHRFPL
jgi:GT2 family glycosyltransferase